jgi:Tol biopolymer transport system component
MRCRGSWRWPAAALCLAGTLLTGTPPAAAGAAPARAADTPPGHVARVASISADGQVVTYAVDTDYWPGRPYYVDYVTDRSDGSTVRLTPVGGRADPRSALSADGRYLAYGVWLDDSGWQVQVCRRAGLACSTASVDPRGRPGNGASGGPTLSADGRYLAFYSVASDLVAGDTNDAADLFVLDRQTNRIRRVSINSAGQQGNGDSSVGTISASGRYVVFSSVATNLVAGDTNRAEDVFVRDLRFGTTHRISLGQGGRQADSTSGQDTSVVSSDGRFIAFTSYAGNLVPGDTSTGTDVFVRSLRFGTTYRVSVSSAGEQADNESMAAAISSDGRFIAFTSTATNLVPGDTNHASDVFIRDLRFGTTRRVSLGAGGRQGDYDSTSAVLSADGRYVAFSSAASNLMPGESNSVAAAFVRDLWTHTTRRISLDLVR